MRADRPGAAIAATLLLVAAAAASADVVVLRNGSTLEGEVVEDTDERVTLVMEGGRVSFEKRLVASIRKEPKPAPSPPPAPVPAPGKEDLPAIPKPDSAAAAAAPGAPLAGIAVAPQDWWLIWTPEKRVGWVETQSRVDAKGASFEESFSILGADGRVETVRRFVDESGPAFEPRSIYYMENGPVRQLTRTATVRDGRLFIDTTTGAERSSEDFPLPADFRTPLGARALVLRTFGEAGKGGWSGTTYDAREGRFLRLSLRVARVERATRDGKPLDAAVLVRQRDGVTEEERIGPDGRVLLSDLDGPRLTAVGTTKERVDAFRRGPLPGEADEERRARTAFVSPEDGFRLVKPGASWEFLPAEGRGDGTRLVLRDPLAVVRVVVETRSLDSAEEPAPAALGATLVEALKAEAKEWRRVEDGFTEHAGRPAFRVVGEGLVNGDPVRVLAVTFAHRGRAWVLRAVAPRAHWDEARPYLERVLGSFEWL